jgi:hypothetical protein
MKHAVYYPGAGFSMGIISTDASRNLRRVSFFPNENKSCP